MVIKYVKLTLIAGPYYYYHASVIEILNNEIKLSGGYYLHPVIWDLSEIRNIEIES